MNSSSIVTAFILCSGFLYHPVHETLWEVQWNEPSGRLEVALRLSVIDEQWINEKYNADQKTDWQADFLQDQIFFDPVKRTPTESQKTGSQYRGRPIKWVGRKEDGAHVWWFFEVVGRNAKPPASVRSRLLFDHQRDYQHWIIVLGDDSSDSKRRPSVVLTRQRPELKLDLVGQN